MLLEPQPTPYDLRFELFGTRVRVHPLFWLMGVILGWNLVSRDNGMMLLFIWVLCSFFSILLHEFGHVWAGKLFGTDGYIVLYSFGGLAVGSNNVRQRWQRICVSLAGPAIQLVFWGLLEGGLYLFRDRLFGLSPYVYITLGFLLTINLYWPLLNLLPIWPLDGGMVTREICQAFSFDTGTRVSLYISAGTAGLVAINSLLAMQGQPHLPYLPAGGMYTVFLFGALAVESVQLLQQMRPRNRYDDKLPWE